jgi:hypothetical protein
MRPDASGDTGPLQTSMLVCPRDRQIPSGSQASLVVIRHAPTTIHSTSQVAITQTATVVDSGGNFEASLTVPAPRSARGEFLLGAVALLNQAKGHRLPFRPGRPGARRTDLRRVVTPASEGLPPGRTALSLSSSPRLSSASVTKTSRRPVQRLIRASQKTSPSQLRAGARDYPAVGLLLVASARRRPFGLPPAGGSAPTGQATEGGVRTGRHRPAPSVISTGSAGVRPRCLLAVARSCRPETLLNEV